MKNFKRLMGDKSVLALVIALSIVLLLLVGFGVYKFVLPKEVYAIDFKELNKEEIIEWYENKFNTNQKLFFTLKYDEEIEEGKVIYQSVEVGERINTDKGLNIYISKGYDPHKEFTLPDFIKAGATKEELDKYFSENKFSDVTYQFEISDKPLNTVLKINVSGKVKRDTPILVVISTGDKVENVKTTVPNLLDYSLANAKAWANSNAITLNINREFSDEYEKDKIISQNIKEGTEIKGGSSITITVSNGKAVIVKNVIGMHKSDAVSTLREQGLTVSASEQYSNSVEKGKVISQNPSANSKVAQETNVNIVVSKGQDPATIKVSVPSYVGNSESTLQSSVRELGLTYRKIGTYYDDNAPRDTVSWNTNGSLNMTNVVEYTMSLGSYNLNENDFNGKNKDVKVNEINEANNKKAGVTFNLSAAFSDTVASGILFDCNIKGKTVTCKYSKGSEPTAKIETSFDIYSAYDGKVESTEIKVKNMLGMFDLSIVHVEDKKFGVGQITSIEVNGNSQYEKGYYPLTTKVVVYINTKNN